MPRTPCSGAVVNLLNEHHLHTVNERLVASLQAVLPSQAPGKSNHAIPWLVPTVSLVPTGEKRPFYVRHDDLGATATRFYRYSTRFVASHPGPEKMEPTAIKIESTVTAPAASHLLAFCDFLERRLHTENLELLRRIVHEFQRAPRESTTLDEMVRLAFPLVTILPIARGDATCWGAATPSQRTSHTTFFREFRTALSTRVVLRHWDWLQQIFDEFCSGLDRTLHAFLSLQRYAISIVPVIPPSDAIKVERPHNGPRLAGTARTVISGRKLTLVQRKHARRDVLLAAFLTVEAQAPWATLYDVTHIELPPCASLKVRARIVTKLSRFWRKHARAVWERNFYVSFASDVAGQRAQHERCRRQDNALLSFELTVLVPCFEAFGAQFFVDLDRRRERAPWWWYRRPLIDLFRLGDRDGVETSLAYMRTQGYVRFPQRPTGCDVRSDKHFADGRSMWSTREKYQYMTAAIEALM